MKRVHRDIVGLTDIYGEIHAVEEGTEIAEYRKSDVGEVSNGLFFKGWLSSGVERLDDTEIGFLVRIMRYLEHSDNTIRMDNEVMSVKEMAAVTGREYTRLSRLVNCLVEKRVMGRHSTEMVKYTGRRKTVYTVNPYIFCKGKMINKRVIEYYKPGYSGIGR